jgi:H+/Cl- antiporter ClcA
MFLISNAAFAVVSAPAPEPDTYLLLGMGAVVAGLMKWKSSKHK